MIVATYAVANEAAQIAESLRSVKAYVDRYVIVDSVFVTNPIDATHSTDETRDVCEAVCYPVPLEYVESDRKMRQDDARNEYLDRVAPGDWIINLDGDEVLYGDHDEIRAALSWLQHGEHGYRGLSIPVLSAAVMFNGYASEMPAEAYWSNPIIHTTGYAPRVFRNSADLVYRDVVAPNGIVDNQGLWVGDKLLGSMCPKDSRLLIVNHHVRQSFEAYQADAVWELRNLVPA